MIDISFIIPSYNSHKTIARTIETILAQSRFDLIKDIVIVDSSDDGVTRDKLAAFHSPKIKTVFLKDKSIPSHGRNTGVKNAGGQLLCFIDSDVYLAEDWLAKIVAAYNEGARAGCGSVSLPSFQQGNRLAMAQWYLQFNESLDTGDKRQVAMVPACNMFCDRKFFEQAGGFPDLRASEDVILCLRLGKITPVWFLPQARCYHMFREDKKAYFSNQITLGKYIIIYRREYYGRWYYRGVIPLILLPAFLSVKFLRIATRIFNAGNNHARQFLSCLPLFSLGLLFWARGFALGCFDRDAKI